MSLAAECLAATTGLWPGKDHPTPQDRLAATSLLDRWESKLRSWLRHPEKVAPFEWKEPPDQADLREKITRPSEPDEEEMLVALAGDYDTGREYVNMIKAGRNYLANRWPKLTSPGVAGELFPASEDDVAHVWNLCRILDDGDALMDEIAAYSATVDMFDAWKMVYPELSATVLAVLQGDGATSYGLLTELHADGRKLSWQQEDVLKMMIGNPREEVPQGKPEQEEKKPRPDKAGALKPVEYATRADSKP